MADKSMLTCPECGYRLYYRFTCRVPEHLSGRECERVKDCPNCKARFMTREVITRKLPS